MRAPIALAFAFLTGLSAAPAQQPSTFDLGSLLHTQRLAQAGYEGQGVRIGVISDGASNYAMLVERGVLPPDVAFVGQDSDRGDEGDWMLQIVHQIAPRARLAFCPGGSAQDTDDCARELIARFRADLVVDDTNPQPVFDFPSPKAIAFAELAQEHPDVLFFTGAGNNEGGFYQGTWTPVPLVLDGTRYLAQDFGRSLGGAPNPYETTTLTPGSTATVMVGTSANPPTKSSDCSAENPKVTVALLDMRGNELTAVSGRCPLLRLQYRGAQMKVQIAVLIPVDSDPRAFSIKLVAIQEDHGVSPLVLSYRTSGSAGNSATTKQLIAVAAVDPNSGWHDHYLYEAFANSGPQCLDYQRNLSGGWTRLPGPQCMQQPAFVVPDRARVLVGIADGREFRPFVGDSAAGPAAAGVAALLLSAHVPSNRIVPLLEQSAIPQTGARGWNPHYGYGLLDADAAGVAAGLLLAVQTSTWTTVRPVVFHPSPSFLRARSLSQRARQGDSQALTQLRVEAQAGNADAQTWLAMYAHGLGDDATTARWALSAAEAGEPLAQNFLGSMYNRGWGVPMDPRAAQAWWLRAARTGVPAAIYNIGTTVAGGRGGPPDPVLGYVLMRAAVLRGFRFPPMNFAISEVRGQLNASQIEAAESLAAHYAADPGSITVP